MAADGATEIVDIDQVIEVNANDSAAKSDPKAVAQADAGDFQRQFTPDSSHSMEWTKVSLSIGDKVILNEVSGTVKPGEMACILGPSGAGKTTLLNILAGRMNTSRKNMKFSGDVSIGGCVVDPVTVRSNVAYVMQEDALPGMSTPREVLAMSCVLRSKEKSASAVEGKVNELLSGLHLEKCADTRVGNVLVKGLSGGEKKRTAVAIELITNPSIIFLDEPLSGLDSYAAWKTVLTLKELAARGCSVLCTVHQPSSEIFMIFNKVVCLAEGRTCYCDEVGKLTAYMEKIEHPVPTHFNPADHLLFQVQTLPRDQLDNFLETWSKQETAWLLPQIEGTRKESTTMPPAPVARKTFFQQLSYLVLREFREVFRNKVGLVMRFLVTGFMGTLFSCIFMGIADKDDEQGGLQGHYGAICNLMISSMFGNSQPLLLGFAMERPIFLREYASNMYGVAPYFIAKTIVEMPMTFLTSMESMLIAYWIVGYHGNFFYMVCVVWAMGLTAASTALMIACSVVHAQTAQELAPLIFVPQILFSGVFVPVDLVPKGLRWLEYVCALKYSINLAVIVEFDDLPFGREFLKETQNIDPDNKWMYVGILVAIFVMFRLLAMFNLRKRAKFVI